MATPTETGPTNADDESAADRDQESRLKRYDQRVEEWLTSLKEGAEQRSPEVLSALATKAKDVGDFLDKLADKARSRAEPSAAEARRSQTFDESPVGGAQGQEALGYRGPGKWAEPRSLDEAQGRGLTLIKQLMSELEIQVKSQRTVVRMRKDLAVWAADG
jgi:hypothetical protein